MAIPHGAAPSNVAWALRSDAKPIPEVKDAAPTAFDIANALERLPLRGDNVAKKTHCDRRRYKAFKTATISAAFPLIGTSHAAHSDKKSPAIRALVTALDLCCPRAVSR